MAEDTKTFNFGRWGSLSVGGLIGAVVVAGFAQFTDCEGNEPGPVDPVVDAGEPVEPDASDVIDANLPEEPESDAGLELPPAE